MELEHLKNEYYRFFFKKTHQLEKNHDSTIDKRIQKLTNYDEYNQGDISQCDTGSVSLWGFFPYIWGILQTHHCRGFYSNSRKLFYHTLLERPFWRNKNKTRTQRTQTPKTSTKKKQKVWRSLTHKDNFSKQNPDCLKYASITEHKSLTLFSFTFSFFSQLLYFLPLYSFISRQKLAKFLQQPSFEAEISVTRKHRDFALSPSKKLFKSVPLRSRDIQKTFSFSLSLLFHFFLIM